MYSKGLIGKGCSFGLEDKRNSLLQTRKDNKILIKKVKA